MMYTKPLPRIDNILWLAKLARPFPTTADEILTIAKKWHFSRSTIDFLKSFPKDEEFKNIEDFVTRSEELELMICEERKMPREILRSPQE